MFVCLLFWETQPKLVLCPAVAYRAYPVYRLQSVLHALHGAALPRLPHHAAVPRPAEQFVARPAGSHEGEEEEKENNRSRMERPWRWVWQELRQAGWSYARGGSELAAFTYMVPGAEWPAGERERRGGGEWGVHKFAGEDAVLEFLGQSQKWTDFLRRAERLQAKAERKAAKAAEERHRMGPVTATLGGELSFGALWPRLQRAGWHYYSGSGLISYYYSKPEVRRKSEGVLGVNMFSDESQVLDFVKANPDILTSIQSEEEEKRRKSGSGSENPGEPSNLQVPPVKEIDLAATATQLGASDKSASRKKRPREGEEEVESPSLPAVHDEEKDLFWGGEHSGIATDERRLIWERLRDLGWKYLREGNNNQKLYFCSPTVSHVSEGIVGKTLFSSESSLLIYAKDHLAEMISGQDSINNSTTTEADFFPQSTSPKQMEEAPKTTNIASPEQLPFSLSSLDSFDPIPLSPPVQKLLLPSPS